jgi:4-aminobutyrate aminotransferase-like enzyme
VAQLFEETRRQGLLIGKGGLYGNVVRISPPLEVTKSQVDDALKMFDQAFMALGAAAKGGA